MAKLSKSQTAVVRLLEAITYANEDDFKSRHIAMSTVNALRAKGLVVKMEDGKYRLAK